MVAAACDLRRAAFLPTIEEDPERCGVHVLRWSTFGASAPRYIRMRRNGELRLMDRQILHRVKRHLRLWIAGIYGLPAWGFSVLEYSNSLTFGCRVFRDFEFFNLRIFDFQNSPSFDTFEFPSFYIAM